MKTRIGIPARNLCRSYLGAGLFLGAATLAIAASPSPAPTASPAPSASPAATATPKPARHDGPAPLYVDTTEYPPFGLTWNTFTGFTQVRGVFPHPVFTQRALLATNGGLSITEDSGRTWKNLPEATAEKIGLVSDLAFHPLEPDTFYAGSTTKGVWITKDNGATFTRIGSKTAGMAADAVTSLIVFPGDPTRRTVLAAHGEAATGISRTQDGGKTWQVLNTDYNFRKLLGGNGNARELFMSGFAPKEPDVQNFYASRVLGELPVEILRDIVPTDMLCAPVGRDLVYVATADSSLYNVWDDGGMGHSSKKMEMNGVTGWSSVSMAWGPNADSLRLFLYDPSKAGLVISDDDLATTRTANSGLLVSPLVKEGAVIRANSNGTVFYAAANGSLMMARLAEVPVVDFKPGIFVLKSGDDKPFDEVMGAFGEFMKPGANVNSSAAAARDVFQRYGDLAAPYRDAQLHISARVSQRSSPPTSVTVDLSRFTGGSSQTPLFDDGRHDDGAADDGVYGLTFAFRSLTKNSHSRGDDWRAFWPGRVAMGVSVAYADGHHEGAVGVTGIYPQIEDFDLLDERGGNLISPRCEGDVTAQSLQIPPKNPKAYNRPSWELQIDAKKGPWSILLSPAYNRHDISSHAALAFWIKKGDGTPPKELYVQLRDSPELSEPTFTERVPVFENIAEGSIDSEYRRVVIPMSKLVPPDSTFQMTNLGRIIISGKSDGPENFLIRNPRMISTYDEPKPPAKVAPSK